MPTDGWPHYDISTFQRPLFHQIDRLAETVAGIHIAVLYPRGRSWDETSVGRTDRRSPEFCRLVQSTQDGARRCKVCHVLLCVATTSPGAVSEQRCHAGALLLIGSADPRHAVAVLSSCLFADASARREVMARAEELGLPARRLWRAYAKLPKLTPGKRKLARLLMATALQTVAETCRAALLEGKLAAVTRQGRSAVFGLQADGPVERPFPRSPATGRGGVRLRAPLLVRVLRKLIAQRPEVPFAVRDVAAAARLSPNHFSTLFRRHTGQRFVDYVASRRLHAAEELLRDLSLNVSEVARRVGYDDPNYFARRFRHRHGMSPHEWRQTRLTS